MLTLLARLRQVSSLASPWQSRPFASLLVACLASACAPEAAPPPGPRPNLDSLFPPSHTTGILAPRPSSLPAGSAAPSPPSSPFPPSPASPASPEQPPCGSDADCGYDPTTARCGADPRWNKQPPLVDQGLVCYCDTASRACALLRVEPVPCEAESSCAIRFDPRPHPVRASSAHPYQKPRRCLPPWGTQASAEELFTTCERTNICTLNRRVCAVP